MAKAKVAVRRGIKRKKTVRTVAEGVAHIAATFNNAIVTITDPKGRVLTWSSAGKMGYKGSRKGTPYAAQEAALDAATRAKEQFKLQVVDVEISGASPNRESPMRAISAAGIRISCIKDVTPLPHNGCRRRKKRRV